MSFGSRLRERREALGLKQSELGKLLGITGSAIGNYELGVSSPKADILNQVFDVLKCDANYLFQDEMKELDTEDFSVTEIKMVKRYRLLDTHGKEMVDFVLGKETERMELEAKAQKEREAMEAAVLSGKEHGNVKPFRKSIQPCSAGTGVYLGPEEFEIIYVEENDLTTRGDFAVPVSGDSMEPTYHDGDILVIEAMEDIPIGKIGLFTMDGEGYVKQRGADALISLNPQYDPLPMREGIRCNGLVIGILDPACLK